MFSSYFIRGFHTKKNLYKLLNFITAPFMRRYLAYVCPLTISQEKSSNTVAWFLSGPTCNINILPTGKFSQNTITALVCSACVKNADDFLLGFAFKDIMGYSDLACVMTTFCYQLYVPRVAKWIIHHLIERNFPSDEGRLQHF